MICLFTHGRASCEIFDQESHVTKTLTFFIKETRFCQTYSRSCKVCPVSAISTGEREVIDILLGSPVLCQPRSQPRMTQHPKPSRHTLLPFSPRRQSTLSLLPHFFSPSLSFILLSSAPRCNTHSLFHHMGIIFLEIQEETGYQGWPHQHREKPHRESIADLNSGLSSLTVFGSFGPRITSKSRGRGRGPVVWRTSEDI